MRALLLVLLLTPLQSGIVRNLPMDGSKAEEIYLCLGHSTVLRFRERPKKIVAGNKNYFDFAFVANDVTIQPLREVSSNLFVYGEYNSYAFNLKFLHGCRYDDLVKISRPSKSRPTGRADFVLANTLKVSLSPPVRAAIGIHVGIIDLMVFNIGSGGIAMKSLKIRLNRRVKQWVWTQDFLKRGEVTKGRILFNTKEKGALRLFLTLDESRHHLTLTWEEAIQ